MKRIMISAFAVLLLCSMFAFTASMADGNEGVTFENTACYVRDDLPAYPMTVETTIYFNKRSTADRAGVFFGNLRGDPEWAEPTSNIMFGITSDGNPKVHYKDGTGCDIYTYTFKEASVVKSEWVHLAITFDNEKKEIRCYINGELCGTDELKEDFSVELEDFLVGGDMRILNPNYFKGRMKSLAVYSDTRTEKEIKADMEKQSKDDLILYYDFSDVSGELPVVVEDKSGMKNDAHFGRIWIDEKEPITDYAYSFAVIGDTQNMAKNYTNHFGDIYNWVYDNIESKNIEMVIGLGDITNDNYDYEWAAATEGFGIIDGYVPHIPIRGNHDNPYWYQKTVSKLEYANMVDGNYGSDLRNTYVEMDIGGIPYLFLQLDFYLDDAILEWACSVVEQHPHHNVIISRHGYLTHNGAPILNGTDGAAGIEGEEMWDRLVSQYENIVLVLSGHISCDNALATQRKGVHGNTVTEMLLDFQSVDNAVANYGYSENGAGVVCMFYFSEDGRTMIVEGYSTVTGQYFFDANCYTIELDLVSDAKYVKGEKAPIPPRGEKKTEIKMTVGSMTATVNGEVKTLDAAPIIVNSRTMLPVRFVAENLGATVAWDAATQTVTIKENGVLIEIAIGKAFAKVDGENVVLDSPAYIDASNNRTYLPVRLVAESLGATVSWDDATKTATLTK